MTVSRSSAKRRSKRSSTPMTKLAFEPHHREIFRRAGDDWTPPADISVRHGLRSWTLTAEYLMASGQAVTLTVRLEKRKGGVVRGDETLRFKTAIRGRA